MPSRAQVGLHERDQRASRTRSICSTRIVTARMRRGLTTIVDSTGLDAASRTTWLATARQHGRAALRHRARRPGGRGATAQQGPPGSRALEGGDLAARGAARERSPSWPVRGSTRSTSSAATNPSPSHRRASSRPQRWPQPTGRTPCRFDFALHVGRFAWPGGGPQLRREPAPRRRRRRGGRLRHDLGDGPRGPDPDGRDPSGRTSPRARPRSASSPLRPSGCSSARSSTASPTGPSPSSGSRWRPSTCSPAGARSAGSAWRGTEREHELYGWDFPPVAERYARLEDALELLPLLWGPGAPPFEGRTVIDAGGRVLPTTAPGAHPDPRRWLGRAAHAPPGGPARRRLQPLRRSPVVAHKVEVLRAHCEAEGRDPDAITVTQLSEAAVIDPGGDRYADVVGTVDEQVGRLPGAGRRRGAAGVRRAPRGRHHRADRALRARDRGLRSLSRFFREAVVLADRRSSWRR